MQGLTPIVAAYPTGISLGIFNIESTLAKASSRHVPKFLSKYHTRHKEPYQTLACEELPNHLLTTSSHRYQPDGKINSKYTYLILDYMSYDCNSFISGNSWKFSFHTIHTFHLYECYTKYFEFFSNHIYICWINRSCQEFQ